MEYKNKNLEVRKLDDDMVEQVSGGAGGNQDMGRYYKFKVTIPNLTLRGSPDGTPMVDPNGNQIIFQLGEEVEANPFETRSLPWIPARTNFGATGWVNSIYLARKAS